MKISIIGGGSVGFGERFVADILTYPELKDGTVSLMDINKERLDLITSLSNMMVKQQGTATRIESTTDRRQSLKDADHVIVVFEIGGHQAWYHDLTIPLKYGVSQAVGCTLGPAGVFRALRTIPVMLDICKDMEELCPEAWLLNYHNPQGSVNWAIDDLTRTKNVGLCHSVQGTARTMASYIGAPFDEISYWAAGVNHMSWFLKFAWKGKDAYPILREKIDDLRAENPKHPDIVRFEIFRLFGYYVSESSNHMSEYVPYFRKTDQLSDKYNVLRAMEHFNWAEKWHSQALEERRMKIANRQTLDVSRSGEYAVEIIHSLETGSVRRANLNVKNFAYITNLPWGSIVEVPCLVDSTGVHPCYVGDLPPQCAALNRTSINVHELTYRAAVEGDRQLAFQAILLDPLTSAVLEPDQIERMVSEMFEAEAGWLPQFKQVV